MSSEYHEFLTLEQLAELASDDEFVLEICMPGGKRRELKVGYWDDGDEIRGTVTCTDND